MEEADDWGVGVERTITSLILKTSRNIGTGGKEPAGTGKDGDGDIGEFSDVTKSDA